VDVYKMCRVHLIEVGTHEETEGLHGELIYMTVRLLMSVE